MDYALALAVYIYRLPVSPITHLFFFVFFFFHSLFLSLLQTERTCVVLSIVHTTLVSQTGYCCTIPHSYTDIDLCCTIDDSLPLG